MSRLFAAALMLAAVSATTMSAQAPQNISVDIAIARSVVDRMPVDTASVFTADVGQVACWTRISGAEGQTIQHVWIHGEKEFPVPFEIGGPSWRVWSTKEVPADWTGEWRVEVRDSAGTVLQTARFTVGS
jgi:hypothetical protein